MKLRAFLLSALLISACAQAQDKATLDLLVNKGLITRAEADGLLAAKNKTPPPATAKTADVKGITIGGLLQTRYQFITEDDSAGNSPADSNGFMARRVILYFNADIGGGFSCLISPEFDMIRSASQMCYLNLAVAKYNTDAGTLDLGLRKVNFGIEEYVSPQPVDCLVPEYSAASLQLTTLNFGARHLGLYWDGKPKDTGFRYGAAITNSQQDMWAPGGSTTPRGAGIAGNNSDNNEPAFWADVAYDFAFGQDTKATIGINTGRIGDTGNGFSDIIGYNPYVRLTSGRITLSGEVLGWLANGDKGASDATPVGINVTGAYKATDSIEPVVRFSHLNGNGWHNTVSGVIQGGSNTASTYGNTVAAYAGFNWYITPKTMKLQTGYEFSHLSSPAAGSSEVDAHTVRSQLQILF